MRTHYLHLHNILWQDYIVYKSEHALATINNYDTVCQQVYYFLIKTNTMTQTFKQNLSLFQHSSAMSSPMENKKKKKKEKN